MTDEKKVPPSKFEGPKEVSTSIESEAEAVVEEKVIDKKAILILYEGNGANIEIPETFVYEDQEYKTDQDVIYSLLSRIVKDMDLQAAAGLASDMVLGKMMKQPMKINIPGKGEIETNFVHFFANQVANMVLQVSQQAQVNSQIKNQMGGGYNSLGRGVKH